MHSEGAAREVETRVRKLAPTVTRIAYHMKTRLPASVEADDLVQSGMLGLLDAAKRYDSTDGAAFESYAMHRIRGAMLDGLRAADWCSRTVRGRMRQVEATICRLEQQKGRAPTEAEVAEGLEMPIGEYQHLLQEARGYQLLSYDDLGLGDDDFLERQVADDQADPLAMLESKRLREALIAGIEKLPEREKLVLTLYYQQELRQREIGEILDITESRVCQMLTQAVARLRTALRESGEI
jgi:RNA polymerase sigma factor for flagellar operon FliA